MADLAFFGAKILDGTGGPWFYGNLFVAGDRISRIETTGAPQKPRPDAARRVIDASQLYLSPGFIDTHSHSDLTLLVDGRALSKITQGVTTELLGEAESAAPLPTGRLEEIGNITRSLTNVPVKVDWTTFRQYFDRLEKSGISVNVVSTVGCGQVREAILGDANRAPTADELARMKALVRQALEDGVVGLSSGLIYPPNSYASAEELIELAQVASAHGGIYLTHIRNEADEIVEALNEAIRIGREAQLPVHILHLKVAGKKNFGRTGEVGKIIEKARAEGVDVTANRYPYIAGSTSLTTCIPTWVHEGGKLIERLRDPKVRERVKREMDTGAPGWSNQIESAGSWENILIASVSSARNKHLEGKNMAEVARLRNADPKDAVIDLIVEENGQIGAIYFIMAEEDVRAALRFPWLSIGSDGAAVAPEGPLATGKPHPRFYGTFPRVLAKYVREEGVISLEEAIRKMTSLPARQLNLQDRGLLREGMAADLVAFDYARVQDRATFSDPHQLSEGIEYVVVNGKLVVEKGRHTGALPGRVLRR